MQNLESIPKQKGATLIIMAFIIGLAVIAYLLHALDPQRLRLEQDKKTTQTLNEAKQALIAWSVSHQLHPGQMPFPDRNKDVNGVSTVYDGKSDCLPPNYVNSSTMVYGYSVLLGQLPVYGQTFPCLDPKIGIGDDFKDADGNKLWYAVSRNLVHKYETYPVVYDASGNVTNDYAINPSVVNFPTYPWLKVVDANGNVLSDKVAAVIISPGRPIGAQNRSATANPSEFLDSITESATVYSNANYLLPNQVFIMGQDSKTVTTSDPRFSQPYNFSDKLVYITIDELIDALNRRAASEASRYLNQYQAKALQFPYAAPIGSTLNNHIASGISQKGFVPVDGTDVCTCSSPLMCSCSFKAITQVTLTRGSSSWASSSNACSVNASNNKKCDCSGSGQCKRGARYFSCDAFGVCQHNLTGSNNFTYTVPSYAKIGQPSGGGCASPVGKQITCNDADQFNIGLDLPTWFDENSWADFLYYEWTNPYNIQLGQRTGISAVLIATGASNTNELGRVQARPSSDIRDYLDSAVNTDNNQTFDSITKLKSTNYNDQSFIVAP